MIKRRLHLQIYATIVSSILLVLLLVGLFFWLGNDDDSGLEFKEIIGQFAVNILPAQDLPQLQQQQALAKIFSNLDVNVSLFEEDGQPIAHIGNPYTFQPDEDQHWGLRRQEHKQGWLLRLPDGRWLFAGHNSDQKTDGGLIKLLLVLSSIALGIGLASYPLVRRLTRRLENLKTGVKRAGFGDLTTRVRVEGKDEIASLAKNFNHAIAQIENLVTSHKTLLANASHELRTPLSRIRLGLEMYQSAHEQKRLDALRRDIAELDELIEEILLMSRLDNSAISLAAHSIDLKQIIKEECAHFPQLDFSGSAPMIKGNATLLKRVIRNLISNAFKHGSPPVIVRLAQSTHTVSLTVQDHGEGISLDDKDKVFDRFYRGSGKQNIDGYGLGLSLVKQIIEAHNGTITILDAKGFIIEITLPINQ